jgi:hypothetical protein
MKSFGDAKPDAEPRERAGSGRDPNGGEVPDADFRPIE